MTKLESLTIPTHIEGYPNFIDLDWYGVYDLRVWTNKYNGFVSEIEERTNKNIVVTYNPSLESKKTPEFLYSHTASGDYIAHAIYLQRDNKRFVFDLTGSIHRIIFGDQEDTTTRIMTEEEFEAAKAEMIQSLTNLEDSKEKSDILDAITTLKYGKDINYPAYIQALTEEWYARENKILRDPNAAAQDEARYETRTYHFLDPNITFENEENAFQIEMSTPIVLLDDATKQPYAISCEKNKKRYIFQLNGICTVQLYGGNLERQMTQEEFNLRTTEMQEKILTNENITPQDKVEMLAQISALIDSANLPTEKEIMEKIKK